jgi:DNA-binding transcriptional regulator YiaG
LTTAVALRYHLAVTPDALRRLRKRLKLTQPKFAALIGVHLVTVKKWETGTLGMKATTEKLIGLLVAQERQRLRKGVR